MSDLVIPQNYSPVLSVKETEHAIVMIKDFFQLALSTELNLTRVTAPLFVPQGTGLNDDLNGVERAVSFPVKDMDDAPMEIVHSLAKWKRVKVTDLRLGAGFGIYTDMNAIRADEELDNVHSLYVDQWDWEMAIREEDRTVYYLREVVRSIFRCLKRTEFFIYDRYDKIKPILPDYITFIYSDLSSKGIRVSPQSLEQHLALRNCTDRKKLYFHSKLLAGELTQTMGGGIGQSRLCMYFLRKAHIGETQVSVWPEVMREQCRQVGIPLL